MRVPVLPGFEAAAFAGARFAVVGLVVGAALADAVFGFVVFEAVLFDDALGDRRAFFGELPPGNAFSIALPALLAAPPTALPALVAASPTTLPALAAAPPTALPALVAAPPTALPGPDAATVPAALLTVPAALPTVFPTLFRILPVSGTSSSSSARSSGGRPQYGLASAVPVGHAAGARWGATRATSCSLGRAPTMRSTGCPPRSSMIVGIENAWNRCAVLGLSSTLTLITLSRPR